MRWQPSLVPAVAATEIDTDRELLARVAVQDSVAFTELYRRYHRRLGRFLGRFTRRYEFTEEIVNDTLYVVWCKAPDFRGESQVSTWIMGIAYRRALQTLRRELPLHGVADLPLEREEAGGRSPEETQIQQQWLNTALAELPLEQRMVLELTYYLGHSCEEIASIMECPVNTVKTRMFNARMKLRVSLPTHAGQPPRPAKSPEP